MGGVKELPEVNEMNDLYLDFICRGSDSRDVNEISEEEKKTKNCFLTI